jgi:hypothetical protein
MFANFLQPAIVEDRSGTFRAVLLVHRNHIKGVYHDAGQKSSIGTPLYELSDAVHVVWDLTTKTICYVPRLMFAYRSTVSCYAVPAIKHCTISATLDQARIEHDYSFEPSFNLVIANLGRLQGAWV